MNYYDEEIIIVGPDTKNLNAVKVDKLESSTGENRHNTERETTKTSGLAGAMPARRNSAVRQHGVLQTHSMDDDGLLQEIVDHDDEDDTEEDSELQQLPMSSVQPAKRSASQRPTSSRFANISKAKVMEKSESDSSGTDTEDAGLAATFAADAISASGAVASGFIPPQKTRIPSAQRARNLGSANPTALNKTSPKDEAGTLLLNITPDKWELLNVDDEVKDIFPYILKYTPQHIEVPYRLQPFIPEFVPAVGDVDAFLKVTTPPVLQATQRQREIDEHVRKLGLYFLDEPSGEQSQPSLLKMKLRSVLTGSGVNPRSASAALIPTAKAAKDIDKWIAEVEQVHITHVHVQHEPRKDIEPLLLEWPREYAGASTTAAIKDAYQRCLQDDITLTDYVRILSERFGVEGPLETQADYILNVQTLFALYLAANQAWE